MNEPDTISRDEDARSPLTSVTFRQGCAVQDQAGHKTVFNRTETAGFTAAVAADLVARQIAVVPGAPLDPPAPDVTPTTMRLTKPWLSLDGRRHFAAGERTEAPRHEVEKLIALGDAVLDDGKDAPIAPEEVHVTQRRARILARGRELVNRTLEKYR